MMTNRIEEALDMRELALVKLRAEKRVQVDMRRSHAIASGFSWNTSLETAEEWYAVAQDMIRQGETFVWTPESERMAARAADKLPNDVPFHRAWLPVMTGYWWLGRDTPWFADCETNRDANPDLPVARPINALFFTVNGDYVLFEVHTLEHGEPTRGPTSFLAAAWREGETLTQFLARVHAKSEIGADNRWWNASIEKVARYFMAACLWLQQRVVAVSTALAARPARRRMERQNINSTVRIVTLRKAEQAHHESTGAGMPLQWRVPVIGHWRNQPYPSIPAVIPIWIDDHWRGPKDAPVKAPSTIIYRVAR